MSTVFVALNFHLQNTKSSLFFIDIVKQAIPDLIIVGANDAWYEIPKIKPETIIIWQKIFTPQEIDSWGAKNVIIIPMYDACPHTLDFWNQYKKYKVFCFCKSLYDFLTQNGFICLYSQYYIEPSFSQKSDSTDGLTVFFWERSRLIRWSLVKKLLGDSKIKSLHYHYSTNITEKNEDFPDENDIKKYNITFSDWFKDNSEYKEILSQTDLFITPRESEGIGLSFIEALSKGCVVAAYDSPTMNEYVSNVDGYLFNENTITSLDFFNIDEKKKLSVQKAQSGYDNWIKSIPIIQSFIASPLQNYKPDFYIFVYLKKRCKAILRHYVKKFLKK